MTVTAIARPVGARRIWILDDAFEFNFTRMIHIQLSSLPYFRKDYDTSEDSQYLHLKHEWKVDALDSHAVLGPLKRRVIAETQALYGSFHPVLSRVHANDIPFGDMLHPHTDTTPGVTALYFANSEWEQDWHGETLFYDGGEAVTAVAPRPGRLAFFPADIVHRTGMPSRACPPTRLTIAFKFATNSQPN